MPAAKDCHTLTSYYVKLYKARYDSEPNINRHTARWGFDSILQGMGIEPAKQLLDYYFTTPPIRRYDLDWFFYNYEKLVKAMRDGKEDRERTRRLMQESKTRAEKWRNSGKQGIADN